MPCRSALALLFVLLPLAARAEPPRPAEAVPADVRWALVATTAREGATFATALRGAADTRGLLEGFTAGIRNSIGWDPADAAALEAAGAALDGPLAIASLGQVELASIQLANEEAADRHLATWLAAAGEPATAAAHGGWQVRTARREGRVVAAHARKAGRAITARLVAPGGDPVQALHRAIDATKGRKSLARDPLFRQVLNGVEAPVHLWSGQPGGDELALGLALEDRVRLRAEGRARVRRAGGALGTRAAFPAATLGPDLLLVRLGLTPGNAAFADGVRWLLEQACPACPAERSAAEAREAARLLAGPAALAVSRLDLRAVKGDRLTPAATAFAWVAQTGDPAKAKAWLDRVATRLGAAATEGDHRIDAAGGPLHFGIRGERLYVASDAALRDRLLAATAGAPAGPGEPLQATLSPARAGEALAGLSVSDALRGGLSGALFALRLQLGPLLRESGPLHLRATPAGQGILQFETTWDLRAAP